MNFLLAVVMDLLKKCKTGSRELQSASEKEERLSQIVSVLWPVGLLVTDVGALVYVGSWLG